MKLSQMMSPAKEEIEKPFPIKLERAKKLIRMFANKNASVGCSFGKDSIVVLWLCLKVNPDIPVIFNNTLVEYKETLALRDRLKKEWNLNLIETRPTRTFWEVWEGKELPDGSKAVKGKGNWDRCCHVLKEDPFKRIIKEKQIKYNFTGITAIESRQRMFVACQRGQEYYHKTHGCWKIHPILYWTQEEVWKFIHDNNIPINEAYAKYSIDRVGCVCCTAHKGWRETMARINPEMYKIILERFFKT